MGRVALVTGGAGFIGSHVVDRVSAEGYRVLVLDDFSTGKHTNLCDAPGVDVVEGDLLDGALLDRAMRGVDVVFHHAAVVSVPDSIEDPLRTHRINAGGTLSVLIAARDAGARRVIYAASSSAYGPATDRAIKETHQLRPISPYGAAKLAGELYCRSFTAGYGLPTVCLRYFNVFGPRQDAGSGYAAVIPAFAAAMLDGRPPTIFGDGLQSRDFVHVADVAEANVLAASTGSSAIGRVFNIGSGRSRSLLELIETLRAVIGPNAPQPVFAGPRAGDIRDSRADITAARRALGFQPRTGFEDGIREYVRSLDRSAI